tara:strand:- start:5124 stop:5384 length:261 start_codon:yes stop_codon:yes gene_type:complete
MSSIRSIKPETLKYYQETYGIKPRNRSTEAAKLFDCSEDTLRKSRSTGYLFGVPAPRHVKIGFTVKYTLEDIVEWMETNNNRVEAA